MNQAPFELSGKRIFVAGHHGMVGSAIVRRLMRENCTILTIPRNRLDLLDQSAVRRWFAVEKPDAVFLAAAKVGGILANQTFPADFLSQNLIIATNVIDAAFRADVAKLMYLGSSCIYPRQAAQPITEKDLLTGSLEPTNEPYAIAKIAGIKLCEAYRRQYGCDFVSVMPTNLYGPGDNYDLSSSHVLPALLRKAHDAKKSALNTITIWGSGRQKREFLHVDDLACACVFLMRHYSAEFHINIGSGQEITISDLARMICGVVGFTGELSYDLTKPEGPLRKLVCGAKLHALGWRPQIGLRDGIASTYEAYQIALSEGAIAA